ncbi:MAG: HlyD family efflux transporter periplasmic adaptor subunit [Dehalococcoidia bacterium]
MSELSPPFSSEFENESSWFRRKLSYLVAFVVVAAAAGGAYWYFNRDSTPAAVAPQQQTATVTTGNLVSKLSTTGTAAASLTSKLTFGAAAKVASVNVTVGQKVAAGDVLGTLESADLQSKLNSAQLALTNAQLKYAEFLEPPTASELASAQSAISSAQTQLANAEENLRKAQPGADTDAITAADNTVAQAQQSLTSAQNSVQSSWISLISAQRNYCTADNHLVQACYESDLPLSQAKVDSLIAEIRTPATSAVGSAAQSFISANNSYNNALTSVTNAQKTLDSANEKRQALDEPPSALTLQQLNSAIQSANASLLSAQQKYDDLVKGPTAADVASQQQSVASAQSAYDTAKTALDAAVLKAPYAGTITAVGVAVGDNVSAATQAFTLTNTESIVVNLSVQETDFVGLEAGQYGTATFEALPDHTYIVKIVSVNPTPTTTQGIVSYQVEAVILSAADLQDTTTQQAALRAYTTLNTSTTGFGARGGAGPNAGGTPGAGGRFGNGANAQGTPGAGAPSAIQTARAGGGFPGAERTPVAGAQAGQAPGGNAPGGEAQGGGQFLQTLLNAPLPTPGMNATVVILKSVAENVVLVPNNAIRTAGTLKTVTVKNADGTTETRPVQTGATDGTNTIVTSGLSADDVVVLSTSTAVTTGGNNTTTNRGEFAPGFIIGGGPQSQGGNNGSGATGGVR